MQQILKELAGNKFLPSVEKRFIKRWVDRTELINRGGEI